MAINQLGRINFPALTRYLIKAANLDLLVQYFENHLKEMALSSFSPGILYGGALSVNAGLALNVSKVLGLFPAGHLLTMDVAIATLGAADPALPRIDRIELVATLTNNSTVVNADNQNVYLDKTWVGSIVITPGTPGASPVAPNATVGRLSLGLVRVNAAQTNLTAASIDQSEGARAISRRQDPGAKALTIANAQASFAVLQDLKFDSVQSKSVKLECDVYRATDANELRAQVVLRASFKPILGAWSIEAEFIGDDPGLEFSIDGATGQVKYKSSNVAGSAYQGTLSFRQANLV